MLWSSCEEAAGGGAESALPVPRFRSALRARLHTLFSLTAHTFCGSDVRDVFVPSESVGAGGAPRPVSLKLLLHRTTLASPLPAVPTAHCVRKPF